MSKVSDKIGEASEIVARTACERLRESGKIMDYVPVDKLGIDILLIVSRSEAMPLQVKSSRCGEKWHRKRYPGIPVVVINHRSVKIGKKRKRRLTKTAEFDIRKLLASGTHTISLILIVLIFFRTLRHKRIA